MLHICSTVTTAFGSMVLEVLRPIDVVQMTAQPAVR